MKQPAFYMKYKIHHLLFWMMLFGLWFYLRYDDYATLAMAFMVTFVKVLDLAMMIYITNYLLIPKLLYKKRYGLFIGCFISLILVSSISKMFILAQVQLQPELLSFAGNIKSRIYDNVVPHFFLVTSGAAIKLMVDYTRMQQRMVEMAKEKAEAELNFLKSQINPHFLFNTLNSVYFLIDKSNAAARNALHKFSDMLRYQLYEIGADKIPVEKEIDFLKDYIGLQELRRDEHYGLEFNCAEEVRHFYIEPLLLIPFVENAFKHISHHNGKTDLIKLDLSYHKGEFNFRIRNSKDAIPQNTDRHGGIGLDNVKKRLALLYPGKHSLEIRDESDFYSVDLRIRVGGVEN